MTEPAFILCPYRFSDHPPKMIDFLRTLGMAPVVSAAGDTFAILTGRSGRVAVHDTKSATSTDTSGETHLCFETRDADHAAAVLRAEGVATTVVDEAYGRHLDIPDWQGHRIGVNEQMHDFYGYQRNSDPAPRDIDVVAVWFTADLAAAERPLRHLGFTPDRHGDENWQALRAPGSAGIVDLHHTATATSESAAGIALGFQTSEPFDDLVARLRSAGHDDARVTRNGEFTSVAVTDPDGQWIEIFPSTQ
jgi:catechol 2,3-dioxygenase-like lactoylglutathione lyase family enzyme